MAMFTVHEEFEKSFEFLEFLQSIVMISFILSKYLIVIELILFTILYARWRGWLVYWSIVFTLVRYLRSIRVWRWNMFRIIWLSRLIIISICVCVCVCDLRRINLTFFWPAFWRRIILILLLLLLYGYKYKYYPSFSGQRVSV